MRSVLFVLLTIAALNSTAQKVIISGKEGNRPLVWADFTGKPDNSNPFFALTAWSLNWKTNDITAKGDILTVGNFEATLELDPVHSWAKQGKLTAELLEHEQRHFNIALLCQRELLAREKLLVLKKSTFSQQLQGLFDEVMKKYRDMEAKYDEETNHSANKEAQQQWNERIKAALAAN